MALKNSTTHYGTVTRFLHCAVFLLFAGRSQAFATTIAGMLAVLAPTVGPLAGGWITQTFGQKVVSRRNSVSTVTKGCRASRPQRAASSAVEVKRLMGRL